MKAHTLGRACIDCRYGGWAPGDHQWECHHPSAHPRKSDINRVLGKRYVYAPFCLEMRGSTEMCGPEGRWWEGYPTFWGRVKQAVLGASTGGAE
jgi:hypothetical protein